MDFLTKTSAYIEYVNAALRGYLRQGYPEIIYDAMSYSVFSGGKRLRPLLLLATAEMLGGSFDESLPFSCAVELIHNSSLIHDDLPALDDDDLRRGKPTCHKRFGEGMAILAGDALLNLGYEVMAKQCRKLCHQSSVDAMYEIAFCSGVDGILGGQTADLISENKKIDEAGILYIIKNKTGMLIKSCFSAGAMLSRADDDTVSKLSDAGMKLGIAFQIKDDILDMEGNENSFGKPLRSDERNNKNTYVSVYGIQKAKDDYNKLSDEVIEVIKGIDSKRSFLLELIDHINNRQF